MRIICPLYNSPYYTYSIDLSSESFILTFRYSSRSQGYVMDIEDSEENTLIYGVSLVPMVPLLRQYSLEDIPGDFLLIPIETGSDNILANSAIPDPRRVDRSHVLVYSDEQS